MTQGGGSDLDGVEETKGEDGVLTSFRYPKVLITVRSELLSSDPGYRSHFLPLESQNEDKNEEHEAINFFRELR